MTEAPPHEPDCPGPVLHPRRPRFAAPPGSCDCHFHVFGPYGRFPLSATRGYTPPEASVPSYRGVVQALGLTRSVIVQPSVYGDDNACTLAAAQALGGPAACRVVAVVGPEATMPQLRALHDAGVRGVRVNAVSGGGPLADQIGGVARAVAPLGWHVQLYLPPGALAGLAPAIQALPTPVVVDHMGSPVPGQPDEPGLRALLRLLDAGRTWVKLSGGYMASRGSAPFDDVAPAARALAAARLDRVVWGTNWPHPIRFREMPDDGDLLDALATWLPDEEQLRAILVDNPAALYGFDLQEGAGGAR